MENRTAPADPRTATVKGWVVWVSAALVLVTVGLYGLLTVLASSSRELFAGFGEDLPTLTRVMFAAAPYSMLLSLLGIVPFIRLVRARVAGTPPDRNGFVLIIVSAAIAIYLLGILARAIYVPIFEIGAGTS